MRRQPLSDSSSIASIGYDGCKRELEIEFYSGDVYRYFEVPEEEYRNFLSSPSRGAYLNHVFKPRGFRYQIVRHGRNRS